MCQKCRLSQPFPSLSPNKTQGASPAPVLFFSFLLFQFKLPLRAECALADGKLPVLCPLKHADPERSSKNTVSFPVTLYITKALLFLLCTKNGQPGRGRLLTPPAAAGRPGYLPALAHPESAGCMLRFYLCGIIIPSFPAICKVFFYMTQCVTDGPVPPSA